MKVLSQRAWIVGLLGIAAVACSGADEATRLSDDDATQTQPEPQPEPEPEPDPGPQVCPEATDVFQAEPADSNLLFLLDRSGSMHLRVEGEVTRWMMTKDGLEDIFTALPVEVNAAVSMFPNGDAPITCCDITADNVITCGNCQAGELPGPELRCDPGMYEQPPVDFAALDALQLEKMMAYISTADDEFYWGTPLAPALDGAVTSAATAGMTGVTSVVLLTDGLPTSCDTEADPYANDIQHSVDAASYGLINGVRTYVVGVIDGDKAADATNLSAIAAAGGTKRYPGCEDLADCAYSVNVSDFESDLWAALESISLDAISCTFDLPEVSGGAPDYDAVNITVTSGGVTNTVPKDSTQNNGWDYLPGNQQVQLYGDACEVLKNDIDAQVEVVVGCKTQGG